jgi:hypothetical protein
MRQSRQSSHGGDGDQDRHQELAAAMSSAAKLADLCPFSPKPSALPQSSRDSPEPTQTPCSEITRELSVLSLVFASEQAKPEDAISGNEVPAAESRLTDMEAVPALDSVKDDAFVLLGSANGNATDQFLPTMESPGLPQIETAASNIQSIRQFLTDSSPIVGHETEGHGSQPGRSSSTPLHSEQIDAGRIIPTHPCTLQEDVEMTVADIIPRRSSLTAVDDAGANVGLGHNASSSPPDPLGQEGYPAHHLRSACDIRINNGWMLTCSV